MKMKTLICVLSCLLFASMFLNGASSNDESNDLIDKYNCLFYQDTTVIPAVNYAIKFPKDSEGFFYNIIDSVLLINSTEDSITITIDDFYGHGGPSNSEHCAHILRTFVVTNWSKWDGIAEKIVITRNEDCDDDQGEEDVWLIVVTDSLGNKTTYLDKDDDFNNGNPVEGTNRCEGGDLPNGHWANSNINMELESVGRWQYTQRVDIFDTIAPIITLEENEGFCVINSDCQFAGIISFTVENIGGMDYNYLYTEVFIDIGNDSLYDEAITPLLIDTIGEEKYRFSFTDTLPYGTHSYLIYSEDECNNVTYLTIPITNTSCTSTRIEGEVKTWEGVPMEEIPVYANAQDGIEVSTDTTGLFAFCALPEIQDITLSPFYNESPTNGVTISDLIAIQKHILGIVPLDNPYKLIAADVNNSGFVTTADLLELQSLLLNNTSEFSNNSSWRFVHAEYTFPDGWNFDSQYPEIISIINTGTDYLNEDFIGIKIGHVVGPEPD